MFPTQQATKTSDSRNATVVVLAEGPVAKTLFKIFREILSTFKNAKHWLEVLCHADIQEKLVRWGRFLSRARPNRIRFHTSKAVWCRCYAVGGAGVDDVEHQIKDDFERDIGQKPEWARWDATDTLFGKQDLCYWRVGIF